MEYYSNPISKLIEELSRLPGVGAKTAQRLAFYIINQSEEQVTGLAKALVDAKKNVRYCNICQTLTDGQLCQICKNPNRNQEEIMVVENPRDLVAYEKIGKYQGVYHVLHGAISPMLGIGADDIRIRELMARLEEGVEEVIIATNSSLEGETTAMYINKLIKLMEPVGIKVKVSRIASGVPVGGDLEYIDEITLLRALEGRIEL
jgi:recombination protein RecR